MSCSLVDHPQLSTSKSLEVNATSREMMITWESLIPDLMKASSLDTP